MGGGEIEEYRGMAWFSEETEMESVVCMDTKGRSHMLITSGNYRVKERNAWEMRAEENKKGGNNMQHAFLFPVVLLVITRSSLLWPCDRAVMRDEWEGIRYCLNFKNTITLCNTSLNISYWFERDFKFIWLFKYVITSNFIFIFYRWL